MPFHPAFVIVALVIVLIIFGPGRLPELGAAVGKAMREFRKATTELTSEVTNAGQPTPASPPVAAAPAPPPVAVADPAPAPATGSESQATSSKN
jgi:sec-independent protein translocase protein TatA